MIGFWVVVYKPCSPSDCDLQQRIILIRVVIYIPYSPSDRDWRRNGFTVCIHISGQITMFHQPRFPWNKGISVTKPPFGVRSCEVAIIWTDIYIYISHIIYTLESNKSWWFSRPHPGRDLFFASQVGVVCWPKFFKDFRYPNRSIWGFPKIMGTPKSSILKGFSIINHPIWVTPIFGNTNISHIALFDRRNQEKNIP